MFIKIAYLKNVWITTKFLWILCIYYYVWLYLKEKVYLRQSFDLRDGFLYILGLVCIYLLCESINFLLKKTSLRFIVSLILVFGYILAGQYRYRTGTSFDYQVFIDNFHELFNYESLGVIFFCFKPKDFYLALFLIALLILMHFKWNVFKSNQTKKKKRGVAYILSYLLLIYVMPYYPFDEFSYTTKSALDFYIPKDNIINFADEKSIEDDLYQSTIVSNYKKRKPHIFLVTIESFNSLYVEKKAKNGKEIIPVFNDLISEGLYVDNFYGNSVQTIKGQFSILCSLLPLAKGKSSYYLDGKKLNCLPKILNKIGYSTYFHKCFHKLRFDNTGKFMKDLGFKRLLTSKSSHLSEAEKREKIWGWGVQDDISYTQYLDHAENFIKNGKPLFSTIHTVSHHMRFNNVPKKQQYIYPNTSNQNEMFVNSLHLSDKFLGHFIKELKRRNLYEDSIIIITGDHSFPSGEHDLYHNEKGYYEEFFKTPFLMIWKNVIKPKRVFDKTYSQIDIMPTLLDVIGMSGGYAFLGRSILKNEDQYAYLIQPYNGPYFGIVKYPYKYIFDKRTGKSYFYNLEKDPMEKKPLEKDHQMIGVYKKELSKFFYNEKYLLHNFR